MTNHRRDTSSVARTSPMAEPIHSQQSWESDVDYARLVAHLGAGPERTYKATAAALGLAESTVAQMGSTLRWMARASAWDADVAAMLTKSLQARQIHARVEQADAGRAMREKGAAGLEYLAADELEAKDVVALITNGAKVESAALGVAEKHEIELSLKDPGSMSGDEIAAEMKALRDELDAKLGELGTPGGAGTSE